MNVAARAEHAMHRVYWRLGPRHLAASRAAALVFLMVAVALMLPVYMAFIPEAEGKELRVFVVFEAITFVVGWLGASRSWKRASEPAERWLQGDRSAASTVDAWKCVRTLPVELVRRAMAWGAGGMLLPAVFYGAAEFDATPVATLLAAMAGLVVGLWVSIVFVPAFELYLRPLRLDLARRVGSGPAGETTVETPIGRKLMIAVPLISVLTGFAVAIAATLDTRDWDGLALLASITLMATLTLSGGMILLLTRALVAPIDDLLDAVRRVADGDLTARAEVTTDDEIGEIGLGFNEMLDSINRFTRENEELLEEVRASRARIIAASDAERVRVERNIHDGAQQRLVTLALKIRMLLDDPDFDAAAQQELLECNEELNHAIGELRELARDLHPAVLSTDGLRPALEQLAAKSAVPVTLDVPAGRWPVGVESTLWFVATEAIANVATFAQATSISLRLREVGDDVVLEVRDDGVGGAVVGSGTGLAGLADRVEAVGGVLVIDSPIGEGTLVRARVPQAIGAVVPA